MRRTWREVATDTREISFAAPSPSLLFPFDLDLVENTRF